jgi:transaldolase
MNAITQSTDYDTALSPLALEGCTAEQIYDQLTIDDIKSATDLFSSLYQQTHGGDGFVSLEVSPLLANDTEGTLAEARRYWKEVDRPNLMVKIPATRAGIPAITAAIADGININITLIFSRQRYAEVMDAYLAGLEQRAAQGLPLGSIASVASFFVSRVDTKVDAKLQSIAVQDPGKAAQAEALLGKAAIANARLAYADFKTVFGSDRFKKLKASGARVQRPLWASTSTKNPAYRDVMYVEELVGADTVDTVPPATLDAILDHGQVRPGSLEENLDAARQVETDLAALGIYMDEVTQQLEDEGVKTFSDAFKTLIHGMEERRKKSLL